MRSDRFAYIPATRFVRSTFALVPAILASRGSDIRFNDGVVAILPQKQQHAVTALLRLFLGKQGSGTPCALAILIDIVLSSVALRTFSSIVTILNTD